MDRLRMKALPFGHLPIERSRFTYIHETEGVRTTRGFRIRSGNLEGERLRDVGVDRQTDFTVRSVRRGDDLTQRIRVRLPDHDVDAGVRDDDRGELTGCEEDGKARREIAGDVTARDLAGNNRTDCRVVLDCRRTGTGRGAAEHRDVRAETKERRASRPGHVPTLRPAASGLVGRYSSTTRIGYSLSNSVEPLAPIPDSSIPYR